MMSHVQDPTAPTVELYGDEHEFVPGTVHLVDIQGTMLSRHASGNQKDIVLIPAPSSDPDDPLNWSARRKLLSTICMAIYVLVIGICTSALFSVLIPISENSALTLNDLNAGTGYLFLMLGWGCLFWQPVALQYGKRPVYLISLLGTLGAMVWAPYTQSNGEWIAAKLVQGFFGAPIESLAEITVADVYFTHERGRYMAVYALALGYSNGIAPLISGFINKGQGWRWVPYWCAIFCGIAFVILFFFFEETNFRRLDVTGQEASGSDGDRPTGAVSLKQPVRGQESQSSTELDSKGHSTEVEKLGETLAHDDDTNTAGSGPTNYSKKSYSEKLKLFKRQPIGTVKSLGYLMLRPLLFFRFPIIVYAGFLYGCNIIWLSVANATQSLVFSSPPYNFPSSTIGITYVAPLVGTTLGALYSGYFGDYFIVAMARRNKGVMEPEHRLWLLMALVILIPFGNILWGVGAAHSIHWFGLVFAMGTISFLTTAGSQIAISYCIDAYKQLSGEALAGVIVIRNTMSFGIGYAVTPWVTNLGYQNAFILGAFLGLALTLTFLPIVKYGKMLRKRSVGAYWHYVNELATLGISH